MQHNLSCGARNFSIVSTKPPPQLVHPFGPVEFQIFIIYFDFFNCTYLSKTITNIGNLTCSN